MRPISIFLATTCTIFLAACDPDYTESAFVTPNASGTYVGEIDTTISNAFTNSSGNGFAYAVGVYPESGSASSIKAIAGLLPGTTVTDVPTSGTATYQGSYGVAYAVDIEVVDNTLIGTAYEETGNITLNANFAAGTLQGNAGGLTVDGTFSSTNLNGTVEFNGVSGDLDGLIGGDSTIGVFHGNNEDEVFAGGFGADKI